MRQQFQRVFCAVWSSPPRLLFLRQHSSAPCTASIMALLSASSARLAASSARSCCSGSSASLSSSSSGSKSVQMARLQRPWLWWCHNSFSSSNRSFSAIMVSMQRISARCSRSILRLIAYAVQLHHWPQLERLPASCMHLELHIRLSLRKNRSGASKGNSAPHWPHCTTAIVARKMQKKALSFTGEAKELRQLFLIEDILGIFGQ